MVDPISHPGSAVTVEGHPRLAALDAGAPVYEDMVDPARGGDPCGEVPVAPGAHRGNGWGSPRGR